MPLQYFFREAQPPSKISPFPQGTQATLDFFSAAKKGDLNGVRQAIAKGADINYPISVKWRGIDSAAYRGYITVVAFLLDAPYINLTAEDNINHWTLMHFAVHGQQFKMVEYLLNRALSGDRRIQIDKKSQKGNTPLMAAKIEGFSEISDILEAATRQLAATLDFFSAAKKGDLNEVRQTIAEGADINYQNDGSWRAIDYAVQYGHMSVVIFLLETPHLKLAAEDDNKWGWTWMHQAVAGNQVNMVEYLLRRVRSRDWRIQIDKKTKSGKTPLMMATTKGFREIIGLLARIPNPPTGAASPPSAGAAASSLIPPRAASMPREWMTSASPLVSPLSTPVPGVAKGEELINLNNNDLWSKLKDDACERPAEEAGRSLLYKSMLSSYTNQRSDLPPQRDAKPFLEEEDKREDDEL
jgi:ankyrin repeat protein